MTNERTCGGKAAPHTPAEVAIAAAMGGDQAARSEAEERELSFGTL
jgi:hypothetical protein